ncbi:Hsp70 family chaperone [Metarhizium guizhouense ARSEF 977]|uniref:Hsp70 family chaperone n=1 Tax=Metarhizium guizhouense (strain ARSEF 977) TaxID=1276136 RepID=A0A0B4GGW0_METGA|nr:Hsp70 family chaperone [Metarhizium guizhouense ARSEF 977]
MIIHGIDIVVSVDLGTTFTGVAWRTPRTPIQVINDWPGSGDRAERKVPTAIVYNADGTLSSWGHMCADDDDDEDNDGQDESSGKLRREFFKIFIDGANLALAQTLPRAPKTIQEAQKFATDYLVQVYGHVKETIERQTGRRQVPGGWSDQVVVFLFSVPTTWTRMETINLFKGIIRSAGFGVEGPRHSAQVDLTEAEAAAVATLKTSAISFKTGSLFLSVDAGGGTTDLSLMRVKSTDPRCPQMTQMAAVKGIGIGSTLIDRGFIRLVDQRLNAWPGVRDLLPANFAVRMSRSHHFRTLKHKFGESVYMQPLFRIPMDGVSHNFNHSGLGIENGRLVFTMLEIQSLFDAQIRGVMGQIREQLNWFSEHGKVDQVEFVILSGGLGSSAYVRQSIEQQLVRSPHPNAIQAVVVPCQDPQLVVVRGLLLDHQQKSGEGQLSVLATRVARASYGIVVRQLYSPARHFNEEVVPDEFVPKRLWAMNQIQWMIRKGDVIDVNSPLAKQFEFHLADGETTRSWDTDIVISQNEASFLPTSMKQAGVTRLCRVNSNLEGVEQHQLILKQKRRTCMKKGYKFYICLFEIRVIVAPADLRFELWFGGQRFSRNHNPIHVEWDTMGARVGAE